MGDGIVNRPLGVVGLILDDEIGAGKVTSLNLNPLCIWIGVLNFQMGWIEGQMNLGSIETGRVFDVDGHCDGICPFLPWDRLQAHHCPLLS